MPDFAGRTVGNRFQLDEKLGSGAYGKVYRALDKLAPNAGALHRAIKILHRHPPGSDKDRTQQREFCVHLLVSGHSNVVTLHQFFNDTLYVYAIMDLCSGGDLFAAITEKQWYSNQSRRIKDTYLQILDAVQHCHDLGIFHRDIKPENILCSVDGARIHLADFGLSTNSPFSGDFGCGSSYYMSPECIGSGPGGRITRYSTRHNDIWALGVVLTNMTTGRNPWKYASFEDECFLAYNRDRNFLKGVLPISEEVNGILKQIFVLDWHVRMGLPELRQKIVELESMFEGEKSIKQPRPRHAANTVETQTSPEPRPRVHRKQAETTNLSTPRTPLESETASAVSESPTPTLYFSGGPLSAHTPEDSLAPPSECSGSSGTDRNVAITGEIPELRLDNPADAVVQEEAPSAFSVDKDKAKRKNGKLLRSAFQRFKGLQSGTD
ncbi:kinase-like protein [Coprinopsis marcescibilis]|uniref:Kinase-like protein n=1 Tax=Coprinopsis marcescibilis TaxID=230819 RepID=A0A5C3L9T6_COPMA|nr:kinase-like protein [Coprinopsis marcescibilis]